MLEKVLVQKGGIGVLQRSVARTCCREVLDESVVQGCRGRVCGDVFGERALRRVLAIGVEECCEDMSETIVVETCCSGVL